MTKRTVMIVLFVVAAVAGCSALLGWYFLWLMPGPALTPRPIIQIDKGDSFRSIASRLQFARVVRSSTVLLIYAELSGTARRIKPGEYQFSGDERIPEVMRHLVRGDVISITVTIPEGLTVHDIAQRLGAAGLVCPPDLERAAREGRLVRALGLGPLGAEGFLFPATYKFPPDATNDRILAMMLSRFYEVITPEAQQRMFELGLNARELVTLASIIEKEARVAGERRLIASVFYNRLKLGMPLQSDPTAEYSFEGESEPAAAAVRIPSTFNTYAFAGLPPGPIANPGLPSIEAALYPAHTDYLYFVARNDGTHIFSRSFKEHEQAIALVRKVALPTPAHPRAPRPHRRSQVMNR